MKEALPLVKKKGGGYRKGKGFSLSEIREAGISVEEAERLGLKIDRRRKSRLEVNVLTIKEVVSNEDKSRVQNVS